MQDPTLTFYTCGHVYVSLGIYQYVMLIKEIPAIHIYPLLLEIGLDTVGRGGRGL